MARIEDGDPIIFLGKKGPTDWKMHKAVAATSDGNAAAACTTKGAQRAMVVRDHERPYVTACTACWTATEIEAFTS